MGTCTHSQPTAAIRAPHEGVLLRPRPEKLTIPVRRTEGGDTPPGPKYAVL